MEKYSVWNVDGLPDDFDGSVCDFIASHDYEGEVFDKVYDAYTAEVGSKWRDDDLIAEIDKVLDEIVGKCDHQAIASGEHYPEWMCDDDVYNQVLERLDNEDGYGKYRLACFLAEAIEEERSRYEDCDDDDYEPDYGWYAGVTIGDRGLEY